MMSDFQPPLSKPKDDPAVQPSHYTRFKIEPRDFVHANKLGYVVGNIIKYVCRYDGKDGLRDLEKAKNYLEYLIRLEKVKVPPAPVMLRDTPGLREALARAKPGEIVAVSQSKHCRCGLCHVCTCP